MLRHNLTQDECHAGWQIAWQPKHGVMNEPPVSGLKKLDSAIIRPVVVSRHVTCSL